MLSEAGHKYTLCTFVLAAASGRQEACVGADGDHYSDSGRHCRGTFCALLRPLHAQPQVHHGQRRGQGTQTAEREDYRVYQSHWTGRGPRESECRSHHRL